jgi:Ca2+-dependent lipid-binding protein
LDTFSKSDPEVHVYLKDSKAKGYSFVGKTEMIKNNLNPDFTRNFILDFYFEKEQWLKFEVYDVDGKDAEHIGNYETTISRIMSSQRQTLIADLNLPSEQSRKSRGKIIMRADSVA